MCFAENADRRRIVAVGPPVRAENDVSHFITTIIFFDFNIIFPKMQMRLCGILLHSLGIYAFFCLAKYSLIIAMTFGERRATAVRFGITISPLKVSEMFQSRPRSTVAPRMQTSE